MYVKTKTAFIAIVGMPNVGKSSLLNALIGRKVAIVSNKPQTTRNRIMGVRTLGETQLVFLDTPGAHRPHTRLGDYMVKTISEAVSGVDVGILVTEPRREIQPPEQELVRQLKAQKLPFLLVINKVDTLEDKTALLPCMELWHTQAAPDALLPTCALTGEGVDMLLEQLMSYAVEGPHFFPREMTSDQSEQALAGELIREKALLLLRQEVPHGLAVAVERLEERESPAGPLLDIEAVLYCERESHKGRIIGKGGAMLKQIASAAREEMEALFGVRVNLQCWVKVKEDWRNRPGLLSLFGHTTDRSQ